MVLDDVVELLKESHHLQRPPNHGQGSLSLISGPFIEVIQATMPSLDSRVLSSVDIHRTGEELGRTIKRVKKNPELRKALREKGYKSMPPELEVIPLAILTGLKMAPYVGTVNGEALAVGTVNETGLVWKENGRNVAGIIAVQSIEIGPHYYGCMLLETGVIQFASFFQTQGKRFCFLGYISPSSLAPVKGKVPEGGHEIGVVSFYSDLRNSSSSVLARAFERNKRVDSDFFEPVLRETLQAARKLGADEQHRVEAYKEILRCAEYAVMFANASTRLQPGL